MRMVPLFLIILLWPGFPGPHGETGGGSSSPVVLRTPDANSPLWKLRTSPAAEIRPILSTFQAIDIPDRKVQSCLAVLYNSDGRDGVWVEVDNPMKLYSGKTTLQLHVYDTGVRGDLYAEFLSSGKEKRVTRIHLTGTGGSPGWIHVNLELPGSLFASQKGNGPGAEAVSFFRGVYLQSRERGIYRIQFTPPVFIQGFLP